jgi:hypothetical protein
VQLALQAGTTLPFRKMEQPDLGTPLPLRGFAVDFPFCMDGLRLDLPAGRARKIFGPRMARPSFSKSASAIAVASSVGISQAFPRLLQLQRRN